MSRDHTKLFLEILNHIKTDMVKWIVFVVRQRIIVYPVAAVVLSVGSVLVFYWLYIGYRYEVSEKDAVSICDTEFNRIVVMSESSFAIPNTTIVAAEVTDFDSIVSTGYYYIYLDYRVRQQAGVQDTNVLLSMDALPFDYNATNVDVANANITVNATTDVTADVTTDVTANVTTANATNGYVYSDARVFCKVSKVSLQPGNKLSRANLEQVVVYNQN